MNLYEKYQWQIPVSDYLEHLATIKRRDMMNKMKVGNNLWSIVCERQNLTLVHYMLGDVPQVVASAKEMLNETEVYFFGDWRQTATATDGSSGVEWWHQNALWMDPYIGSLAWASALDDWQSAKTIARYADERCEAPNPTDEMKWIYLMLRDLILDDRLGGAASCTERVLKGRSLNARSFLPVILALEGRQPSEFEKAMNEYLAYFRKHQFKRNSLGRLFSFEATVALGLWRRSGGNLEISAKFADFVLRI